MSSLIETPLFEMSFIEMSSLIEFSLLISAISDCRILANEASANGNRLSSKIREVSNGPE
jgi:hypothetical protein